MSLVRIAPALLLVAMLAGCAASGPKMADMEKSGAITALQSSQGRVYFYRDNSFVGGAIQPNIMLDGKVVGESKPGGFFYVDTAPGPHSASTATEVERNVSFTLDAGETKYVKTSVGLGLVVGHILPELVSPSDAQKAMAGLSYTGGPAKP